MYAEKPQKDIHGFIGKMSILDSDSDHCEESLGVENTIWAGAVVASGTATGITNRLNKKVLIIFKFSETS